MKLFVYSFITAAFIRYGNAAVGKTELIEMAAKHGAPFTEGAQQRIDHDFWNFDRANRSSDVVIINLADKVFNLVHNDCELGDYSLNLYPETTLPEGKSSVYGIESNEFSAGATCITKYTSEDGSWFEMFIANPHVIGHNVIRAKSSNDLSVLSTLSPGQNNQVRFLVRKSSF